jgi:acyl-CoA thioesterase-1
MLRTAFTWMLVALTLLGCRGASRQGTNAAATIPPSREDTAAEQRAAREWLPNATRPPAEDGVDPEVPRPVPNPLISRGKPTFGSSPASGDPKAATDGAYGTFGGSFRVGHPTAEKPAWVAIQVGKGYERVLLLWQESGSYNYRETTYGSPKSYRIEVSADSTNGEDGTWREVVAVPNNEYRARAHSFAFSGQAWVKLLLLSAPENSPNGIALDEVDVHDLSLGGTDTWFFMGDSITAHALRRSSDRGGSFAELVQKAFPKFTPVVINAGIGGESSHHALRQVDTWLSENPDFKYWALGYGTNDAAGNASDARAFKDTMTQVVQKIRAQGRVPILARIPAAHDDSHAGLPAFNAAIDELTRSQRLPRGPNLYAWFQAHPEHLEDRLHPNAAGILAHQRLWFEAVAWLYPR